MKLRYSWQQAFVAGEAQKVLNGMSDSDCRNYAKIVDKLELQFSVEKQCELHQGHLTTVDNRNMKVFKLLLQISAVCPV